MAEINMVTTRATHCKEVVGSGRYKGRRCGNAVPCEEHDILPLARALELEGPDEYPSGYYEYLARERLATRPMRVRIREDSVLR